MMDLNGDLDDDPFTAKLMDYTVSRSHARFTENIILLRHLLIVINPLLR